MNTLANAVVFQLVWFAAVIGAGRGLAWPGVAAVAVFALLQLGTRPATRVADLKLMALAACFGLVLDSIFVSTGLLRYAAPWPSASFAPAWIVALWINLALGLNHSLRWLQRRPWLSAFLGAAAATTSFLGAARGFDAVAFAPPTARTLAIVAACWAVAMPLLFAAARRWSRDDVTTDAQAIHSVSSTTTTSISPPSPLLPSSPRRRGSRDVQPTDA